MSQWWQFSFWSKPFLDLIQVTRHKWKDRAHDTFKQSTLRKLSIRDHHEIAFTAPETLKNSQCPEQQPVWVRMITCVGLLSGVRLCHLGNHFQRHIYTSKSSTLSNIMLTALIWNTDKIQGGEIPLDRADWAFLMFSAYGVFRLTGDRKESHYETIKCIADGNMKTQLHVWWIHIMRKLLLKIKSVFEMLFFCPILIYRDNSKAESHNTQDIYQLIIKKDLQREKECSGIYKLSSIDSICGIIFITLKGNKGLPS